MKWQDAKFNTDGDDLIYETPGDEKRGNPLDIVPVVTVNGGIDVTGFKFPAKKLTKELCTRWNCFQDLLAACQAVVEQDGFVGSGLMRKRVEQMKDAIAAVQKERDRV